VPPGQLESARFLVTVSSRRKELELELGDTKGDSFSFEEEEQGSGYSTTGRRESQGRRAKDPCIGRVALGGHRTALHCTALHCTALQDGASEARKRRSTTGT
jgi:hypothetical protein